jgi:Zn ribbon nucleic-acid-binding protein
MLEFYHKSTEKRTIYYKCSDCGYITTSDPKRNGCKACNKKERALELLKQENFYFEPLKITYKKPNSETKYNRRYITAKCKQCGIIETMRDDNYIHKKGCKKCGTKEGGKNRILKDLKSAKNRILSSYKANAKNRGYVFEIGNEKFFELLNGNCYYCNAKPRLANYISKATQKHPEYNFYINGVDRLDNDKGYIEGNVVSCCTACNLMKKELHHKHFINKIFSIYKNLNLDKNKIKWQEES